MDLFKRAESRARVQGPSVRARLAGVVRMLKQCFRRQPEMPAALTEINAALDDHSPLPEKIRLLKKETLQREAEALGKTLQKAAPFVPLLDDSEPYYRKSITIFNKSESVPLDDDRSFSSDVRLVLYEDGRLTRALRFRETCTRGFGWEQEEEEKLACAAAVSLYGLDAIASGLAGALEELSSIKALHGKLEERRLAIVKILEALQRMP
ncbi:MAG: hypothetical protein NTV25_10380 [Methanothrix sp.]|nr:hypothetical protein [Methanothrix sp.]